MKEHYLKGRKQSPEHIANKAKKCSTGCACKRHTAQKADDVRAKHRHNVKGQWDAGTYKNRSEKSAVTIAAWTDEQRAENSKNRSEAKKKEWAQAKAEGRRRNIHFGTNKRTSKHELALVPYMEALGYRHNTNGVHVGRRIPDFIDEEGKRIYEYMGTYWHPPEHEHKAIQDYTKHGYTCTVLWESDLYNFLDEHRQLVTEEEHDLAWKTAKVNNGFKKPSHLNR